MMKTLFHFGVSSALAIGLGLVGAANFYIDSTHERPLPSQLLVFLAEYEGFPAHTRTARDR